MNSVTATYDALGRMVETGSGSSYQQFVFRPSGALLAIYNAGTTTLVKGTVPVPGGDAAIYNAGGLSYLRHTDWLGSSRLATTWAHAVYSKEAYAPFGETYNEAGTADRSFTGQDQDVVTGSGGTGAYDFLFRKHDPSAGRWLSPDPYGWNAVSLTNPQTLNRYGYALNNPLSLVDPLGLATTQSGTCYFMSGVDDAQATQTEGGYTGVNVIQNDDWGNPGWAVCTGISTGQTTYCTVSFCPTGTGGGGTSNNSSCLAGAGPLQVGQSRCASRMPKGSNLINANYNNAIPVISGTYNVPGAPAGTASTSSNALPMGGEGRSVGPNFTCYTVHSVDCGVTYCAAYNVPFQQLAPGIYIPKPGANLLQISTQCATVIPVAPPSAVTEQ